MKPPRFILTLLAALCLFAAAAHGQTIKSLGYNSTNGQIVAATNVVWTNAFSFVANTVTAQVRTNMQAASATNTSAAFGVGHVADRALAIVNDDTGDSVLSYDGLGGNGWQIADAQGFRINLSLGLAALTNTSNVTAMRALSGSTNTNHPYSGSISVTGTNNTNTLVFSNGILQEVQ